MQKKITKLNTSHQQRGLALIMSLVILLILTLLGVTSMNTSNLQMLMTSNSQYQTSALNSAEEIMQSAQDAVNAHIASGSATQPTGYYFIGANAENEIDLSSFNWDGANVGAVGSAKYIIEYTGDTTINAASLAWRQSQGIAGDTVSVFRITARAPASRGAMRYVQTVFVTIQAPNS